MPRLPSRHQAKGRDSFDVGSPDGRDQPMHVIYLLMPEAEHRLQHCPSVDVPLRDDSVIGLSNYLFLRPYLVGVRLKGTLGSVAKQQFKGRRQKIIVIEALHQLIRYLHASPKRYTEPRSR